MMNCQSNSLEQQLKILGNRDNLIDLTPDLIGEGNFLNEFKNFKVINFLLKIIAKLTNFLVRFACFKKWNRKCKNDHQ